MFRLTLVPFNRCIGYFPSVDQGIIPWLFERNDAIGKLALLVAEHARLTGADEAGIEAALVAWFADPDLRLHWLQKEDVPLVTDAQFDDDGTLHISFTSCFLTFDELEVASMSADPKSQRSLG
jgi:hypothetical protein